MCDELAPFTLDDFLLVQEIAWHRAQAPIAVVAADPTEPRLYRRGDPDDPRQYFEDPTRPDTHARHSRGC